MYFIQWDDCHLTVNRDILLSLLNGGYTTIACQEEHVPVLAAGGIGQYVVMPLRPPRG